MKLFILSLFFISSLCSEKYHENELWGKPCLDDSSIPSPIKSAEEVVKYTNWTLEQLDSYKDVFIRKLEKHHETFHELIQFGEHDKQEWLRQFNWFIDEILPANKLIGLQIPKRSIENVMANIRVSFDTMTKIHAALKFILGTINKITQLPMNEDIMKNDLDLKRSIKESMRIIRSIICSMGNYMKNYDYQKEVLLDDFLPNNITHPEAGLILRDTINYLEYIKQLFEALHLDEDMKTALPDENDLWGNPCDVSPPPSYYFNKTWNQKEFEPDPENAKQLVSQIVLQAAKTFADGLKFKDEYTSTLCNYPTFNQALEITQEDEWLRKVGWYRDEVLPESKSLFTELPSSYMSKQLMTVVFPKVLPLMHKGAKKILSGLNRIITLQLPNKPFLVQLKLKLKAFMLEVQRLLCLFSDYLRARGQEQLWLFEETRINRRWIFPIFRDSLNYLEYISEVFEYIARLQALGLDPYKPQ